MKKVINRIKRRLSLLKFWFFPKLPEPVAKNLLPISFLRILRSLFIFSSKIRAKKYIKEIIFKNNYLIIYFKNITHPLYYPRQFSQRQLYQIIIEIFDKKDWHYYTIPKTKVNKNDVVVDCGAAEGLFGLSIAEHCKKVYVIEPVPKFVEGLKLTFKELDNVEILSVGLGNKKTTAYITDDGINSEINFAQQGTEIEVTTIDELFYKQDICISYLKADLEGYELEMLKGARQTIAKCLPKIAITTYHYHTHALWIYNYLKEINSNYKIIFKGIEERAGMPVMIHAWIDV